MNHDPLAAIVAALDERGYDPRSTGPDSYESRCPVHQGRRPNLCIKRGDDGRALIHCQHAPGCSHKDIVAALGLTEADLFPPDLNRPARPASNGKAKTRTYPTVKAAVTALAFKLGPARAWLYHTAAGAEHMAVGRFDKPADRPDDPPVKTYRPLRRTADGWELGDPPGPLPLYRLPDLAAADRVFVVEGEKAADLAVKLGITATTSAHGAKSAAKTDWSPLAGKTLIICPDHDEPGESYATALLSILDALRPRPVVKVVRLADLWRTDAPIPVKGDIEEWLSEGVPESWTPEQCRAELVQVADLAPAVTLAEARPAPVPAEPRGDPDDDELIEVPTWPAPPDPAAYHGVAGEIARAIEPHTEADPVAMLTQTLVGFGNLTGQTAHVSLGGTRHYANENVGLVGSSSNARKGTSLDVVEPSLKATDPGWTSDHIKSGLSTAEGLIYHVRDPVMGKDPKSNEIITTDPGVEDKRLLIVETELGSVLARASQSGSTLTAVLRQAFDGRTLATLTRNSPLKSTGSHISIIGHITNHELLQLLTKNDTVNGFANRFLWLAVRRSKRLPFEGGLDLIDFRPMHQRLQEAAAFARTLGRVERNREADRLWASEYDRLTDERPGAFGSVVARATCHVMRLALIYALLDLSPEIRAVHLRAALALWDYAERSAAYIFGDSLGNQDADNLLLAIKAAPEGLTRTEISVKVFQKNKKSGQIKDALAILLKSGLIHQRADKRWFAGPTPYEKNESYEFSRPTPAGTRPTPAGNSSNSYNSYPQSPESNGNIREEF